MEIDERLLRDLGLPDRLDYTAAAWSELVWDYWLPDADGRIGRNRAEGAALDLREALAPACERIAIAGSISRQKARVKDIEILCQPLAGDNSLPLLATAPTLDALIDAAVQRGQIKRGDKNGPKYKQLLVRSEVIHGVTGERHEIDIKVNLTVVLPPAQWGVLQILKTGPQEFSEYMKTARAQGGALPDDCVCKDGAIIRFGAPVPMPDEQDFFTFCGLVWREPWKRTKETVQLFREPKE